MRVIHCHWGRDTFKWEENSGWTNSYGNMHLVFYNNQILLLEFINLNEMNAEEVALADDVPVAGSLNNIKD